MINAIAFSILLSLLISQPLCVESFLSPSRVGSLLPSRNVVLKASSRQQDNIQFDGDSDRITDTDTTGNHNKNKNLSRRSMIEHGSKLLSVSFLLNSMSVEKTNAIVGSLPEFSDTNGVLQGITIDVADLTQQEEMTKFLRDGFGFKVLRQRKVQSVTETVGFPVIV